MATGFSVAGEAFDACVLPELIFQVGWVPIVPYGTPGTPELGERIEPFIGGHDALILANHGAVTMGSSLDEAQIRMESLEHSAKIIFTARLLGRVNPLTNKRFLFSPERLAFKQRRQDQRTGKHPRELSQKTATTRYRAVRFQPLVGQYYLYHLSSRIRLPVSKYGIPSTPL